MKLCKYVPVPTVLHTLNVNQMHKLSEWKVHKNMPLRIDSCFESAHLNNCED